MTRQRKAQKRLAELGWCSACGKRPLITKSLCLECREKVNERAKSLRRKRKGAPRACICRACGESGHYAKTCPSLPPPEEATPITNSPPCFRRPRKYAPCARAGCGVSVRIFPRKPVRYCSQSCAHLAYWDRRGRMSADERHQAELQRRARKAARIRGTARHKVLYTCANAARNRFKKKQPCSECGSTKNVVRHHDDYTKPLAIRWLCRACHMAWHKENQPIFPPGIPATP